MAIHRLTLLGHGCANGESWFNIGMVAKCGWIFVAELSVPSSTAGSIDANQSQTNAIRLSLRIVHHTPRVQCFNSSNERLTMLGGMALQFSLPEIPIPSSSSDHGGQHTPLQSMIWLGDVKAMRYTLPPKDKYVLCEDHANVSSLAVIPRSNDGTSSSKTVRHAGEGLILAHFDKFYEASKVGHDGIADEESFRKTCICARLSLPQHHGGSPLSLAVHPSGEWMVVGYGMNGRGAATKSLELVSMRKRHSSLG